MASMAYGDLQHSSHINLPMPNVESLSDSETVSNDDSITRPVRAFFLGCRKSLLITPRDLEEGRFFHSNSSSTTLAGDESDDGDDDWERTEKTAPAIPDRNPLHGLDRTSLPAKKGPRFYRYLRWNFGTVYRRIFCLSFFGNIVALAFLIIHGLLGGPQLSYQGAATAVSANILAAIVVRNEHIVNALFLVFGTWPTRAPLSLRRLFAKVYSYGGIHSGCSVAATAWYIAFVVLLTQNIARVGLSIIRSYLLLVSYVIVFFLAAILVFAHPRIRSAIHNWFEGIHRFLGWSVVVFFWAQTMLLAADTAASSSVPFGMVLVTSPSFWMLLSTTLLIIYPWTRLRLRDVEAEVLSDHCVKLNFSHSNAQYGQAVRLTDAPLRETHAFAVIPNPPAPPATNTQPSEPQVLCCRCGSAAIDSDASDTTTVMSEKVDDRSSTKFKSQSEPQKQLPATPQTTGLSNAGKVGFSVLVSNAGDWTKKIIRDPPKKIYTRGAPQFGVLRVAGLFKPCIVMATGSGIGPCLSLFVQKPDHPVRIIWSAPRPVETYGQAVIDLLYRTDPRAVIIDTRKTGRPDLVGIAHRIWETSRWEGPREFALGRTGNGPDGERRKPMGPCEAVVIISNQKVTKKVVYGLESRGITAYGAIFDS
jgi:hypothetical protein